MQLWLGGNYGSERVRARLRQIRSQVNCWKWTMFGSMLPFDGNGSGKLVGNGINALLQSLNFSRLLFSLFFDITLPIPCDCCVWFEEIRFNLAWHIISLWGLLVDVNVSHIRTPFVCTQQKRASQKANSEFPIFTLAELNTEPESLWCWHCRRATSKRLLQNRRTAHIEQSKEEKTKQYAITKIHCFLFLPSIKVSQIFYFLELRSTF